MTVNVAGRGRRGAPAVADTEPGRVTPTRRRRGGGQQNPESSADSPVLVPVGATALASTALMPMATTRPAESAERSAPEAVPAEGPAVLHPSDRRGPNRPFVTPPRQQLAIGEIGQTLFDCPACRRPLALGTRRCPGCGIRLIAGVPVAKAAGFVAGGLVVGLLGGLVLGGGLGAAGGVAAVTVPSAQPTAASSAPIATTPARPGDSQSPTAHPAPTVPVAMPPATAAAMALAIGESDRLAVAEAELRAALASSSFDSSAVAQTLRSISAESVFGEQIAGAVVSWSGSSAVGADLRTFYSTVHETATDALDNSVRNAAAYRAAARTMANLLATRTAIDEQMRAVAAAAGVTLPEPSPVP